MPNSHPVATPFRHMAILAILLTSFLPHSAKAQKVLELPFPRLAIWWPDPENQPLREIARYDYVMLFDYQKEFVRPLKRLRPDIILLNSTNACEVSNDFPEPDVKHLPAEWFLTQVGATLTQEIDATTQTIPVDRLTVTREDETFRLFVPGDTVLIEGESMVVRSIDRPRKTLNVRRGFVRPASGHAQGTRIAAHVTFWPGSWVMNLSTLSPTATFDAAIGPERWGDYHARQDAKLLKDRGWDGLTIDRADPNQSWLVGGSTARTLDPDQSNQLPKDYSEFDQAWNKGLRRYEARLRQQIGKKKILYVNWGMNNFDLLNGNNYEGFPLANGASYRGDWRSTMLGPLPDVGGYLEWTQKGQSPNLTTIQTYEDDSSPPPDDLHYDNPFEQPDFRPNYQKMRFGLGTALLGDGFFAYEINTNGHGTLGLMWFDEYDNCGAGRGYLGKPISDPFRIDGQGLGDEQIKGGKLNRSDELAHWQLNVEDGHARHSLVTDSGKTALPGKGVRIDIAQTSDEGWQISFSQSGLSLEKGKEYTLQFRARADKPRTITVWAQQNHAPWKQHFESPEPHLTRDWQSFEFSVTPEQTDPAAILNFGLGDATGSVWIDDVSFRSGSRDVWRRDFENGIVIVNATAQRCKIDLKGTFRKLKGKQVPAINDGKQVTQVILSGHDALILLNR